jgi:phage terminase small subunit
MALTPKDQLFADNYLVDLNATQAAIKAGFSPKTAHQAGHKLLRKGEVASYIEKRRTEKTNNIVVDRQMVLERWAQVAFKDASSLIETKVGCCRYCHGFDHAYQHTQGEWERRCEEIKHAKALRDDEYDPDEDDMAPPRGGFGYDPRRDPHPDCPECFGEGVPRTVVGNSRGNPLYAGAKRTKDGLEIKTHDQMAALANIAKNLGMLKDTTDLNLSGSVETTDTTVRQLAIAAMALFRKTIESDK